MEDNALKAHLVRSNPIARLLRTDPLEALLIVSGPDAYISPDWYETPDQVPTWNYVAVHLRGRVSLLPHDHLLAHLEALSTQQEAQLLPKRPWTHDKMTDGVMERMMRQILPILLEVESLEQTWKLNQNKEAKARLSAAEAVEASLTGHNQAALAAMMRRVDS